MLLCHFMVVSLKWLWQLRHHNATSLPGNNLYFLTVRWAPMARLFPPWPLHEAPGGLCVSLWRVCRLSSLCCLTKLLSRYSPQSFIWSTCSALHVQNWHWVKTIVLLLSSGQTGRGWCCGKTKYFLGFAAIVQSESGLCFCSFKLSPPPGTGDFCFYVCSFHIQWCLL